MHVPYDAMAGRHSGKYLANLLRIWDLEPSETPELLLPREPFHATSPVHARQRAPSLPIPAGPTSTRAESKTCYRCQYVNEPDSNWCIECGSAISVSSAGILFAETQRLYDTFECSSETRPETHKHELSSEAIKTHTPLREADACVRPPYVSQHSLRNRAGLNLVGPNTATDLNAGNSRPVETRGAAGITMSSNDVSTASLSRTLTPLRTDVHNAIPKLDDPIEVGPARKGLSYRRHWETSSSLYMWRKPSSSLLKENANTSASVHGDVLPQKGIPKPPSGVPPVELHKLRMMDEKAVNTVRRKVLSADGVTISD